MIERGDGEEILYRDSGTMRGAALPLPLTPEPLLDTNECCFVLESRLNSTVFTRRFVSWSRYLAVSPSALWISPVVGALPFNTQSGASDLRLQPPRLLVSTRHEALKGALLLGCSARNSTEISCLGRAAGGRRHVFLRPHGARDAEDPGAPGSRPHAVHNVGEGRQRPRPCGPAGAGAEV